MELLVVPRDVYRAKILTPSVLVAALGEHGCPIAVTGVPGVGKTYAIRHMILSGEWRKDYDVVIILMPTRELGESLAEALRRGMTVASTVAGEPSVVLPGIQPQVYPSIEDAPCGPSEIMSDLVGRGCGQYAMISVCQSCAVSDTCRWFTERKATIYQESEVIIVSEQLLKSRPDILRVWVNNRRALVIDDEAIMGKDGFITTFSADDLELQRRAAVSAGYPDLARELAKIGTKQNVDVMNLPDLKFAAKKIQASGVMIPKFRYIMDVVYDYIYGPLWNENGEYAVRRNPSLPPTTIFTGGHLAADHLAWAYGLDRVVDLAPNVIVLHPSTKIVIIRSGIGAISNLEGNGASITNLVADLIVQNVEGGLSTVLLGCKDRGKVRLASKAIAAVRAALVKRGLQDVVLLAPDAVVPKDPNPKVIPFVTYGSIGSNAYENYDCIAAVNSFNIPSSAVRETAFGHLPPSKRPKFDIMAGRRIVYEEPVDQESCHRADMVLRRKELDAILQAAHRVRFATSPRTVFLITQHDLRPFVGRAIVVANITEARPALGLATTRNERRARVVASLARDLQHGLTLKTAAAQAGVDYSTARLWASEEGLPVCPPGRPPKLNG